MRGDSCDGTHPWRCVPRKPAREQSKAVCPRVLGFRLFGLVPKTRSFPEVVRPQAGRAVGGPPRVRPSYVTPEAACVPCVEPLSYSRGTARLRYSLDSFLWKCVRVLGHVSCCSLDLPL